MTEDFSGLQAFLDRNLGRHCRDHVLNTLEIEDKTPEYREEYKSHKRSMEMSIWRNGNVFAIAYYMKVSRKTLHRFGFSDERIQEEFEQEGHSGEYPY